MYRPGIYISRAFLFDVHSYIAFASCFVHSLLRPHSRNPLQPQVLPLLPLLPSPSTAYLALCFLGPQRRNTFGACAKVIKCADLKCAEFYAHAQFSPRFLPYGTRFVDVRDVGRGAVHEWSIAACVPGVFGSNSCFRSIALCMLASLSFAIRTRPFSSYIFQICTAHQLLQHTIYIQCHSTPPKPFLVRITQHLSSTYLSNRLNLSIQCYSTRVHQLL